MNITKLNYDFLYKFNSFCVESYLIKSKDPKGALNLIKPLLAKEEKT